MKKRSKRYQAHKIEQKEHSLKEALSVVLNCATAKFDESVDVAFHLGIDPKHADQMIRGSLLLPHGTGKKVRIVVITSGENIKKAELAGADFVGGEDLITKISGGWLDFDKVVATMDMMPKLSKLSRVLGPKGLMPNPKLGTVTTDVTKAVEEQKAGKVDYRSEKNGVVHLLVGKKSFGVEKLEDNFKTIVQAILRAKPATSKGVYLKSIALSSTMGPGVKLNPLEFM